MADELDGIKKNHTVVSQDTLVQAGSLGRFSGGQGREFGFGKPFAIGINEEALVPEKDRFIQIVSCNTHNIATLVKTLGEEDGSAALEKGRFVCMRRANDVSQDSGFAPAPSP